MIGPEWLFILIIIAGLYMAWSIGANDVANAMGTSVGSGALTLFQAVIIASVLEFSGAYFFGSHVSATIQTGIVDPEFFADRPLDLVYGMLASLIGVGVWLQLATYFGWPVSTTHSIIGALIGFGAVIGGVDAVQWETVGLIGLSWIVSPLVGGILGFAFFTWLRNSLLYRSHPLAVTKKIMPYLVFAVSTVMALFLFFDCCKNLHLPVTYTQSIFISLAIGLIASFITVFLIKKYVHIELPPKPANHAPEMFLALEKARKQLANIQANGEQAFQLQSIIQEMDALKSSLSHPEEYAVTNQEFKMIEKMFGALQIISACLMAFAHGANDVANAIGPLAAATEILKTGTVHLQSYIPDWTLALGGFGIVLGLATWGWRVIETIGKKLTELTPTRGFVAEFSAALTILTASRLGMPISTTHTLVGAVVGVGFARGLEALNLAVMRDIILSWIITIPAGALLTLGVYSLLKQI